MSADDRLELLERKLDALTELVKTRLTPSDPIKAPNLTLKDFAALAGRSYSALKRDLRIGKIRRINGRIPRSQLSYYIS